MGVSLINEANKYGIYGNVPWDRAHTDGDWTSDSVAFHRRWEPAVSNPEQ